LDIEIKVFCSTGKNKYRKPLPTIKKFFPEKLSKSSFYCGDAAGRIGDFEDTDYKFAINCDLNFKTPEHFFLDKNDTGIIPDYCIDEHNNNTKEFNFTSKTKEMIIMVGYPGSGKSSISKILKKDYNYIIINQDTLKTKTKCIKEAENNMKKGNCVVIDATNPKRETRKEWIKLAKSNKYTVRIIQMTTSLAQSKHNNIYRSWKNDVDLVPDIAYNTYKKYYEKPDKIYEDVEEIISHDMLEVNEKDYYMYLGGKNCNI